MTREETLNRFKKWCQEQLGNHCSDKDAQMANNIMALLEQEPCEDCISRQAVLDIFGYVMDYWKEHAIDVEPHEIEDALIEQYEFTAKQLNELPSVTPQPCEDAISGKIVKEQMIKYGFHAPDMTVTEFVEGLLPVTPQPKTGHWQKIEPYPMMEHEYRCSECYHETDNPFENFCSECGARMVKLQGSEREKNE